MKPANLRTRLKSPKIILTPGVYDALTASLAEAAGFEAAYISGAAIAYTRLGRPDIGLVSMVEVAETIQLVRDRVELPLIVDADTGYGNALNVQRTVRLFERSGANALQMEDQTFPKRCGHLKDKSVIAAVEMVGKIKAAVDARKSEETLIIARTDAIAVNGFQDAIERAEMYREAGADMLFIEAPGSQQQLESLVGTFRDKIPLMANMVEGGLTPIRAASELEKIGYSLVIFPGAIVRAISHAAREFYATLHREGTTDSMRERMFNLDSLNEMIGTPDMLELGKRYEEGLAREHDAA
jgi:2-methylisocitrate lyase-like PEP mutase family enzyme